MKKSEIQALLAGVSSVADVITFAAANNLNATIDPNSTDVDAAKQAVIALGQDDVVVPGGAGVPTGIDFGALMAQFDADAATVETPAARQARIIADLLAVEINGVKVNRIIKDIKSTGRIIIEKKNGMDNIMIGGDKAIPALNAAGQIVPMRNVFSNPVVLGSVLSMAGYGECVDWCTKHPQAFINVMSDATYDVVTQLVVKGEVASNPFSAVERLAPSPVNRINPYIVNLKLGEKGLREIQAICDAQRIA